MVPSGRVVKLRRVAAAFVVVASLLAAAPAGAHDSLAPPGAEHSWLPDEDWVMHHWLPFDETRLYAALGIDNVALERWLRDDHRTIAQLARRRTGVGPEQLADYLVAPWRDTARAPRVRVLRKRTLRVLTQGHLAQHLLYHYFHVVGVRQWSQRIYGVPWGTVVKLRLRGLTPLGVGRVGGRSPSHLKREFRRLLALEGTRGIRRVAQTSDQAEFMLRRRTALLRCFLHRPLPRHDPGQPYGERYEGHGPHARHVRNGLLPTSKQVRARHDPSSCWAEPTLVAADH